MKTLSSFVLAACLGMGAHFSAAAQGTEPGAPVKRMVVPQGAPPAVGLIMPITIEAIDSQRGEASKRFEWGTMWVQAMRQKFGTQGPVTVTSKVVHRFKQEGCARIQTIFNIHEAHVVGGALKDVMFSVNYNTCQDGSPPTESLDIREVQKLTNPVPNMTPNEGGLPPVVPFSNPGERPAPK